MKAASLIQTVGKKAKNNNNKTIIYWEALTKNSLKRTCFYEKYNMYLEFNI